MRIIIVLSLISLLVACKKEREEYKPIFTGENQHQITVKDMLNSSGYTYLLADEKGEEYWIAVSKIQVEKGQTLYFKEYIVMEDFKSEELDRTFETILFVSQISAQPIFNEKASSQGKKVQGSSKKMVTLLDSIQISPKNGSLSVEEVLTKSASLAGKKVKVHGQVIKVNNNIMDRNWVHVMDGTKGVDKASLTFTTTENVQVGDTVMLEGVLAIDKEFGAGYVYPVIIEKAEIK